MPSANNNKIKTTSTNGEITSATKNYIQNYILAIYFEFTNDVDTSLEVNSIPVSHKNNFKQKCSHLARWLRVQNLHKSIFLEVAGSICHDVRIHVKQFTRSKRVLNYISQNFVHSSKFTMLPKEKRKVQFLNLC